MKLLTDYYWSLPDFNELLQFLIKFSSKKLDEDVVSGSIYIFSNPYFIVTGICRNILHVWYPEHFVEMILFVDNKGGYKIQHLQIES